MPFYKCITCQAETEPPLLPASQVLNACPKCGQPVTLISHDTTPPPAGEPAPCGKAPEVIDIPAPAKSVVRTNCRGCGGEYHYDDDGTLLAIDHKNDCDRAPEPALSIDAEA